MSAVFQGLTWDHPRGFNALDRAGRQKAIVHWDRQPLEGFESAPIADLCARYDLVVLDHPHLGEALAKDCLWPLEKIFSQDDLRQIAKSSIGSSYRSYEMAGNAWALPLDAAGQVMALRPEYQHQAPESWDDCLKFAERTGGMALSLAGPHAVLSLMSIAAAYDAQLDLANGGWLTAALFIQSYELLAALYAQSSHIVIDRNPIGILDAMSENKSIALCPLIYGYVPYAARPEPRKVLFRNAPFAYPGGRSGSILGGTGIGISRRCVPDQRLIDHLVWLLRTETQTGFIAANDGQPSARAAWRDVEVNRPVGGFYCNTIDTLEHAAVRPRHHGYIKFQAEASELLRQALAEQQSPQHVCIRLQTAFDKSINPPGGTGHERRQ